MQTRDKKSIKEIFERHLLILLIGTLRSTVFFLIHIRRNLKI